MWTNTFVVLRAAEAWFDASTRPGHGLHVVRAEDEQGTQQELRLVELFQRSSGHMFSMCSEERYSECPGGLWRPGIGFSALLASYRGRAGMSSAQGRLKMRFSGRTKKFRVWPPCRHNTSSNVQGPSFDLCRFACGQGCVGRGPLGHFEFY